MDDLGRVDGGRVHPGRVGGGSEELGGVDGGRREIDRVYLSCGDAGRIYRSCVHLGCRDFGCVHSGRVHVGARGFERGDCCRQCFGRTRLGGTPIGRGRVQVCICRSAVGDGELGCHRALGNRGLRGRQRRGGRLAGGCGRRRYVGSRAGGARRLCGVRCGSNHSRQRRHGALRRERGVRVVELQRLAGRGVVIVAQRRTNDEPTQGGQTDNDRTDDHGTSTGRAFVIVPLVHLSSSENSHPTAPRGAARVHVPLRQE